MTLTREGFCKAVKGIVIHMIVILGVGHECCNRDQQGDIGDFLPPEGESDISFS